MRTKRFLSIVLTFAMLVGMFPGTSLTTYAEGNTTEITPTNTSGTMNITLTIAAHVHDDITFKAWTATDSMPTEAGNYYLANDVTIGSTWNVPTGTTNLCLNGHAIKSTGDHRMMEVGAGVTLSLYDEGAGVHKYTLNGDGLAVVDDNATGENVKTFEGGYLTGAYASNLTGACVLVKDGGIFNMHGGTMIGNYAAKYAFGGAVSVQASRFEMTGGKMIGNVSMHGAVDTRGYGDGFIMKGGEISYNTASNQGGAVCMGGGGIATISGGKITNNIALGNPDGGSESGGIVFRSGASALNISGNPIIKDNVGGDVYLWSGKKINVVGELTNEASIGITIKPATGTSGYASGVFTNSSDTSFNILGAFFSNSQDYAVGKNADGQLFLGAPVSLTYDGNGATGGNVPVDGNSPYASGSTVTVLGNTGNLVKEGYAFNGWNTKADGTGVAYAAESTITISADVTLYAQWLNHAHTWTYQADGATITATCVGTGTCDVAEGLSLTISAPTHLTYDGNAKAASLSTGYNTAAFPDEYVIKYYQGTTEIAAADVKNAGDYTAKVTVGTGTGAATASVGFTIAKAPGAAATPAYVAMWAAQEGIMIVSCVDETWNIVYGQEYVLAEKGTAPNWANARELDESGAIVYTDIEPATEYVIYARVKEAANTLAGEYVTTNYVTSLRSISIVGDSGFVGATCTVIPEPEDAMGLTYQWYHANYDEETGSITRGEAVTGAAGPSFTTTVDDIGKYFIVAISKGGMELNDTYIGPIDYGVVEFDAMGGSEIASQTGTVYGDKVTKPTDPTRNGYNFVGWYSYYDGETYSEEWNFESDVLEYAYLVLYAKWEEKQPAAVTTAPVAGDLTYNGTAQALVSAGSSGEGTMQYALGENATTAPEASAFTETIPAETGAGTYYVWYKVKGDDRHLDCAAVCVTVEIKKKAIVISGITAADKVYDGTASATVNTTNAIFGGIVTGDVLTISVSGTFENANVGNAKTVNLTGLTLGGASIANYELANSGQQTTTTATISRKAVTITAANQTVDLNGSIETGAGQATLANAVTGHVLTAITLTADTTNATTNGVIVASAATIQNGSVDVTANYDITYVNGVLTVLPAVITGVSAANVTVTYDGEGHGITVTGMPEGTTVTFGTSEAAVTQAASPTFVNAADEPYVIYYQVSGPNYVTYSSSATVKINRREVVVSGIRAEDKDYDGNTEATLDFRHVSFANLVNSDAGKLGVTATGNFEDAEIGKGKAVLITGLTLTGEAAGNYVLAAAGQQTMANADVSHMTTVNAAERLIVKIKDFEGEISNVSGLDLTLATSLLTSAELMAYEGGSNIVLELEIMEAGSLLTGEVAEHVTNAVYEQKHTDIDGAQYLDISLYKTVGEGTKTKVTDLGGKTLSITISVPEYLRETRWNYLKIFYIVREHDGVAKLLYSNSGNELTFESDLFSVFALAYKTSKITFYDTTVTETGVGVSPKTYEESVESRVVIFLGILFGMAAMAMGAYQFRRRRKAAECK